jgi:putative endopeptidase
MNFPALNFPAVTTARAARAACCVAALALTRVALAGVALVGAAGPAWAGPAHAVAQAPASGIEMPAVDRNVRAQDDLFRHVNGTWLRTTPMPADKSFIGAFETIEEETQAQLRALIQDAAKAEGNPQAAQIGRLYASFMDEGLANKLGAKPLQQELAAIEALNERKDLTRLLTRLARAGVEMPLGFYVDQDARNTTRYVPQLFQAGLALPDRDFYLQLDDAKFKAVRQAYVAYLTRLFVLTGDRNAAASAQAVLALETELATVQWSRVENRDPVKTYNRVDVSALPSLAASIDWKAFLAEAGYEAQATDLIVAQPSYFTGLGGLMERTPLQSWRAYAKARVLHTAAPFLSKPFVDAHFNFTGKVLSGTPQNQPRWKRGVALVEANLGEALGQLYVAKHFPPEHKARMEKLVANLLASFKEGIDALDWMSPQTKTEAQAKLATFTPKIGYPNKWIDYSALDIRADDLLGNVMRANAFAYQRNVAKLGKPIDREEWGMTPQTVNAYYNPLLNEIVFPAAILKPPFFNAAADDAVNYGGIGAVIGHEISHGFDDQGSQFDGQGNLRDWWTPQDRQRFGEKTQMLVAQYGAFEPIKGYKVNGELTLGENIADISGLTVAYKAYVRSMGGKPAPVIDGLSGEQRFFYGFAQVWRGKHREAALLNRIKSDPHSPAEFRANGTVRNHPGFYSAFGLKAGDKLWLEPKDRVSIW